jgi:hypothetical protein
MQWLRMIPSEEARRTQRGIRRYFELQGESIELSDRSDDEDDELEEDDEEEEDEEEYMDEKGRRGGVNDINELED